MTGNRTLSFYMASARTLALTVGWFVLAAGAPAQAPPPRGEIVARVDNARITVSYGRPFMDRSVIFGPSGNVPFNTTWRTGGDAATTFTTDKGLRFGAETLPRGRYSLFSRPGEKAWQLIFNRQVGQWGSLHDPSKDVLRVTAPVVSLSLPREQFTIFVDNLLNDRDGGEIRLEWERVSVRAHFSVQR